MTSLLKHKRVEFSELFYDLVFVYAISKTTALIHHLHHGVLTVEAIASFLMALLVLVNSWMIQTVYTNRFGKNSLLNIVIMFINMGILLLVANMITNDWHGYFKAFCLAIGSLTFTLFFQYVIEYFRHDRNTNEVKSIRVLLGVTGIRTIGVLVAAFLPMEIGIGVYTTSIIGTFLAPMIMTNAETPFEVNLPHLIERISLLVIITFGEMIMGLANHFKLENFNIHSLMYFLIMLSLFMFYFGEFDHAIDNHSGQNGIFLIYSHYLIFLGLLMMTVSLDFLVEADANRLFVTIFFYIGIGLFQAAVLANGPYNKDYLRYSRRFYGIQAMFFIVAFGLSLVFLNQPTIVIFIATVFTFVMEFHFIYFYMSQTRKNLKRADWDLY